MVRESARRFFSTARKTDLGPRLNDRHRAWLSSYLLNLWRGPEAVRKLIVDDICLWIELGALERAADTFLVLRQFLSDFPEAMPASRPRNPQQPFPPRFRERRFRWPSRARTAAGSNR